jgi:VWFA-related protein
LLLGTAFSCTATAQDSSGTTFHTETSLVLVPTLVTTPQGRVVFGLHDKDFMVTDNGVEQTVEIDETFSNRPVSMVIAVQRGGRAPQVLGGGCPAPGKENVFTKQVGKCVSPMHGIAQMLETFLNDPGSEMALVSFDSHVRLRQDFTPSVDEVTKELETLPPGDGGSAILDAIQYSLNLLRQRPDTNRRVLIVVSEKVDRGSSRITLDEAARQVASTNTEVYMIAMEDQDSGKAVARMIARLLGPSLTMLGHPAAGMGGQGMGSQQATTPLTGAASSGATQAGRGSARNSNSETANADQQAANWMQSRIPLARTGDQADIPQTIANLTGGEYVLFSDSRGLDDALGLLANHAHNRYQLSYRVASSQPGLHRISVGLREPLGVYVAARTSYWLTAPADHPAAHPEAYPAGQGTPAK